MSSHPGNLNGCQFSKQSLSIFVVYFYELTLDDFFLSLKSNEQTTYSIFMLINDKKMYWLFNETASLINSDPVLSPHCYFELEMRQQKYSSFILDQK